MLFDLQDLTKTYSAITALRNLTVSIPEGAIGLLGPNGAGKTTLIRAVLGLITLNSGRGTVLGLDIRTQCLDIRQKVGFAPEDECLFPGVVGIEFVAYAGEALWNGPQGCDAVLCTKCSTMLDWVKLVIAKSNPTQLG